MLRSGIPDFCQNVLERKCLLIKRRGWLPKQHVCFFLQLLQEYWTLGRFIQRIFHLCVTIRMSATLWYHKETELAGILLSDKLVVKLLKSIFKKLYYNYILFFKLSLIVTWSINNIAVPSLKMIQKEGFGFHVSTSAAPRYH